MSIEQFRKTRKPCTVADPDLKGPDAGRACRRRVRKLYLAPGLRAFACRRCAELCYTSQREDDMTRALSKAQATRVRLGGSAAMQHPFPTKPETNAVEDVSFIASQVERVLVGLFERWLGNRFGPGIENGANPVENSAVHKQ